MSKEVDVAVLSAEVQLEVLKALTDLKLEQERTNALLLRMGQWQGWIARDHDPTDGPVRPYDERKGIV